MYHASVTGHRAWMPYGGVASAPIQSRTRCEPYAPAHIRPTRTIGRRAYAAIAAAKRPTKITAPMLCEYVRWMRNTRSASGIAPSVAQISVKPLPARRYHDAGARAVRQARRPGTRSAVHATAAPPSTWPRLLGIGRSSWQILRAGDPAGESALSRKLLTVNCFHRCIHGFALDFRSARL